MAFQGHIANGKRAELEFLKIFLNDQPTNQYNHLPQLARCIIDYRNHQSNTTQHLWIFYIA